MLHGSTKFENVCAIIGSALTFVTGFEKRAHFVQNANFWSPHKNYKSLGLLAWFVGRSGLPLNKSNIRQSG